MMTFGARLKQARANKKLTQNDVADKLGIDFTTISKYENNRSEPDNEILREMASMYEVTLDWLISGQERTSRPTDALNVGGIMEPLSRDEARHLMESLEMYRLYRAKRDKDAGRRTRVAPGTGEQDGGGDDE